MKKTCPGVFFVFMVLSFTGCVTGKPLLLEDLEKIGWDNAGSFQYYLSSRLTLTKLPDVSGRTAVNFSGEGAAYIRDPRWTIVLQPSLEGRVIDYHRRDQYLYVAFEDGEAALPFGRDKKGMFSLILTVDGNYEGGVEFVEYEGARYKPDYSGSLPHLNVVINRSQDVLRRQMQGSRVGTVSGTEEAINRAGEKFIGALPENAVVAVLNISSNDRNTAVFILEELEFQLVESGKFRVVDRNSPEAIRSERDFQLSGEVSDESAVSIGNLLGANIVITGAISGTEGARRLTLKALDVQTAEILVTARESL
jgi:TolB-like protein